jgi:hypothetical protein
MSISHIITQVPQQQQHIQIKNNYDCLFSFLFFSFLGKDYLLHGFIYAMNPSKKRIRTQGSMDAQYTKPYARKMLSCFYT